MPWVVTEKGEVSKTGCKNDRKYKFLILVRCTGKMQEEGILLYQELTEKRKYVQSQAVKMTEKKNNWLL